MSITLDQVTKRYHVQPVVNDVSLEVPEGEFFVLLGPSGSGKSTLLRAIAGLTGIDHGQIALNRSFGLNPRSERRPSRTKMRLRRPGGRLVRQSVGLVISKVRRFAFKRRRRLGSGRLR